MPVITDAQAQALAKVQAQNQGVLATTQWQWLQMANSTNASNSPAYALSTPFRFTLANTSGFVDKIRLVIQGLEISNSSGSTAGKLNRNGFYQLLGSVQVALGNNIYNIPGGAIALLWMTYQSDGQTPDYPGINTYSGYSSELFAAATSVAASGNATYVGWIDIPFAVLEPIYDSDGMAPTLANTGLEVMFTTPASLQGADCFVNPFGTAGTLAVTTGGSISVYAHLARQVSVTANKALPPFVVGPSFVFQDVPQAFQEGLTYYTFQGQESQLILVKSVVVIDSPGELANEYSDPNNLLELDLMYDQSSPVVTNRGSNQPYFNSGGTSGLMNWMVDQRQRIGDQPPGVYVFDFGAGTDPNYPNSQAYFNLQQFTKAGLQVQYGTAPQSGAQIHFLNQYLVPNFFKALASS